MKCSWKYVQILEVIWDFVYFITQGGKYESRRVLYNESGKGHLNQISNQNSIEKLLEKYVRLKPLIIYLE